MNCVILQPSYIPWRGYFHQIRKADVFVFYDDVQYDHRGWRNRNRIKTPRGAEWLTIPVLAKGVQARNIPICDVQICWDRPWNTTHLRALQHNYAQAPFFSRYQAMLERWYQRHPDRLADFDIETTVELAREIGITDTRFLKSSDLGCSGAKTERLLQILKKVGATHYISGPAAKEYLDVERLSGEGIGVEWMTYDYPEYPQLFAAFDPYVSIVDLLLMTGPRAAEYIWT